MEQTTESEPDAVSAIADLASQRPRSGPFVPVLALIVATALGLRFYSLAGESLWCDEIFSVWMCRLAWPGWWHMMYLENHPPLYYLTLRLWMEVFGGSDLAVRSLSVISGALAVTAIAFAVRRIAGPRAALFAASLAAVMPQLIRYSQEARMYSMAVLFAALALGGALGWMERGDRRNTWLYAIPISLCIYTHYYGLLLWAGLAIGGALYLVASARPFSELGRWVLVNLIPAVAFLPWLPVLHAQLAVNWNTHWLLSFPKPADNAPLSFIAWCFGLYTDREGFLTPLTPLASTTGAGVFFLCVAVVYGIVGTARPRRDASDGARERADRFWRVLFIGIGAGVFPALIAWQVSSEHNIWQAKYLLVCTPGLICVVATAVVAIRNHWVSALLGGTLMANCLLASLSLVGTMGPWNQEQWREAAQYLRTNAKAGDIAVVPEQTTLPPYSLCLLHYGVETTTVMGIHADLSRPEEVQALTNACRRAGRLWLVERSGFEGNIPDFLTSHGFHATDRRAEFTRISVQLYERRRSRSVFHQGRLIGAP